MKANAIPAQITTVEDRIAGSLSLIQLLLLTAPLFLSVAIYYLLPPFGRFYLYKLTIFIFISLVSGSLAVRLKGKLLVDWLNLRMRYELRPRIYTYNPAQRPLAERSNRAVNSKQNSTKEMVKEQIKLPTLSSDQLSRSQQLLLSSRHEVTFKVSKKGGLNVQVAKA